MSELESKCHKLKLEIKQWEYDFRERHGRAPSKDDVKESKELSRKYKKYQYYKGQLMTSSQAQDPFATPRKNRQKTVDESGCPLTPFREKKDLSKVRNGYSSNEEESEEEEVEEYAVGPTPQLNGRVLGLFDLEDSPVKKFVTPRKGESESSPQKISSPAVRKQLLATPTKSSSPMMNDLMETPIYLKRVSTSDPLSNSPKRFCRSLSNLIAELREMKESGQEVGSEELDVDEDYEEIDDGFEEHLGEIEGDVGNGRESSRVYKKKGQKRTTRRYVMRPTLNEQDLEKCEGQEEEDKPTRRRANKPEENFRRLKLMNSGHKGAPRNSRFRRRR
ncbi:hypothetical protein TRVA0_018S02784 [Trichomonascus vanleenenianus]|uniref:Sld2p n=1 Tax=Trichomonascus vanleenenianus TaxID=2268995 RepID=UPI003ECB518C